MRINCLNFNQLSYRGLPNSTIYINLIRICNDDTTIHGDSFTYICTNSYPKIRTGEGNLPFLFADFQYSNFIKSTITESTCQPC